MRAEEGAGQGAGREPLPNKLDLWLHCGKLAGGGGKARGIKDIDQQRGFRRYFWKAAPAGG
jgi:hypothetical protein